MTDTGTPWGRSHRIGEDEATGREPTPVLDTPLQSPELARGKHAGVLPLQTLEELLRRPMRFSLEPLNDAGPRRLEGVLPGPPVPWRFRASLVRRSYLAGPPRMRQTPKKPVELGIVLRHRMARRARGQGGKVMLNRTNLVQEPEWIQRPGQRAEPVLHLRRESRPTQATAHTESPASGSVCERGAPIRVFSASLNEGWNTFTNRRDAE